MQPWGDDRFQARDCARDVEEHLQDEFSPFVVSRKFCSTSGRSDPSCQPPKKLSSASPVISWFPLFQVALLRPARRDSRRPRHWQRSLHAGTLLGSEAQGHEG